MCNGEWNMNLEIFSAENARQVNANFWENYFHDNLALRDELIDVFDIIEKVAKKGNDYINYIVKCGDAKYLSLFRVFLKSSLGDGIACY